MVTFASNDGGALGMSDLEHNSVVGMINLTEVESAVAMANGTGDVEVAVTEASGLIFWSNLRQCGGAEGES